MSTKKMRLDVILEERGIFASRQAARTAIMDGAVLVDGVKITKPGTPIKDDAVIRLRNDRLPQKYVSRGGLKLEKAMNEFSISAGERVCLDVGASTGGFTDCLLQSGAKFVYAVDVGYGQIAWSLRTDERVRVIERSNARYLNREILQGDDSSFQEPDLAVIDVSFISLKKILPAVKSCLREPFQIVALVKPQFEAGPQNVGKGGVVRSAEVHKEVIRVLLEEAGKMQLFADNLTYSPIKGPQGNVEFLLLLSNLAPGGFNPDKIDSLVEASASL